MYRICLLLITLSIFSSGCKSIPELTTSQRENISKIGFLDNNHFQIVIKGNADKYAKGLVARRESAMLKARNSLQKTIFKVIMKHIFKNRHKSLESNSQLRNKILAYLEYGSIITEYYDKYYNAYIIYRIKKANLKKSFALIKKEY
jgi:hypothetical protein